MTAATIDGRALAKQARKTLAERIAKLKARGLSARLDAILVGTDDSAASVYAENQGRTCNQLGIEYRLHKLPSNADFDDIAGRVLLLNTNDRVFAIMVHMPLPESIEPYRIQRLIAPDKDVEGVNPANIGNIVYGRSSLAPCTGLAALRMIESVCSEFRGKKAVIVGASDIVGKPIAVMLMRREATVISCNKWTPDLPAITRDADILVAAAGVPGLITAEMVKPGAVVVDVGVNRVTDDEGNRRTVGDVAYDAVRKVAGHLSPVPGGVGPMTVAMLLSNVVDASERAPRAVSETDPGEE